MICNRLWLYILLMFPVATVLILIFVYLWRTSYIISLIFLGLWLIANVLEGYCCAIMGCPYIGKKCHPIGGFLLSNLFAKWLFHNKINRTSRLSKVIAGLATVSTIAVPLFPIFWLAKLGIFYLMSFIGFCFFYAVVHTFCICSGCGNGKVCVMAKISRWNT